MKQDTRNYGKFHQRFFKGGPVLPKQEKPDWSEDWRLWQQEGEPELERNRQKSIGIGDDPIKEEEVDWMKKSGRDT